MLPRERFAWVWLSSLIVVMSLYFAMVAREASSEPSLGLRIGMLAVALGSLGVVAAGTHALMYVQQRRQPEPVLEDERDRLIEARSSALAYYVLMAGMCLVGCVMPFSAKAWDIVHAAILAIVVAEVVHYGALILGYRRGWRV